MMAIPIFPFPQWARTNADAFALDTDVLIVADGDHAATAQFLANELQEQHALTLTTDAVAPTDRATITLGLFGELPSNVAHEVRQAGGYTLAIKTNAIRITGYDAAGIFYGVQSLLQLVAAARGDGEPQDDTILLPGVQIVDWPYKPLRAIHLYMPGRKHLPFFKRLLALLASLKYNTLFLEVGGGMEYKRRPEINRAWEKFCVEADAYPGGATALYHRSQPFTKDSTHTELGGGSFLTQQEVAELLAYAHSLHIEVIPEVQALSHCYYLCCAYPEIAERADDPWPDTCCPSNPLTYEVLFDVMAEVIEVFAPRIMHIGHDEVYHMGLCPRCQGKAAADLLADEIMQIYNFLAPQGVRLAMWGDKLLPFEAGGQGGVEIIHTHPTTGEQTIFPETYQAIAQLPRDILMSEWLGNSDPRAIDFFIKQGFEVCCGNFGGNFEAHAFPHWMERSAAPGVIGAQVPTWCEISEFALGYNGSIFNTLFSAPLLWWSHYQDLDREFLLQHIAARMPAVRRHLGEATVLTEASQNSLLAQALPIANQVAPAFAPLRPAALLNVQSPALTITVGAPANGLRFTHTCHTSKHRRPTWAIANPYEHPAANLLAYYTVRYADGEEVELPIHYGTHCARWDIPFGESHDAIPYAADPVAIERDPSGRRVTLYTYEWTNPQPHKAVADVTLSYLGDEQGSIWLFDLATLTHTSTKSNTVPK